MPKRPVDPVGIYLALLVAPLTLFFAYAGAKGVWDHLHGSRADSADLPVALLALACTPLMVRWCLRLVGRHAPESQLLSGPELLLGSLFALGGTTWSVLGGWGPPRFIVAGLAAGFAGLWLWWSRRGASLERAHPHT